MEMEPKVLIVDDEVSVLSSLERSLRKENYEVVSASSGVQALELLKDFKFAVILSDINMPGMNGIEFLARSAQYSPDSVKMVLSGYADIDLVMDSINRGHVWRYLTKPWQPEDVRVAIDNAVGMYQVRQDRENLLTQLEIKNNQLTQWSSKLEDMVSRRTEHIQNELMLMSCLMQGDDMQSFSRLVLPLFSELFKTDNVSIISVTDGVCYDSNGLEIMEGDLFRHQISFLQENSRVYCEPGQIIIPIMNADMVLGGLRVLDAGVTLDDISSDYESYIAITSIALLHNTMKQKAPEMISEIEKLLQEIG